MKNEDFANADLHTLGAHHTQKSNKCIYIYIFAIYGQFVSMLENKGFAIFQLNPPPPSEKNIKSFEFVGFWVPNPIPIPVVVAQKLLQVPQHGALVNLREGLYKY